MPGPIEPLAPEEQKAKSKSSVIASGAESGD